MKQKIMLFTSAILLAFMAGLVPWIFETFFSNALIKKNLCEITFGSDLGRYLVVPFFMIIKAALIEIIYPAYVVALIVKYGTEKNGLFSIQLALKNVKAVDDTLSRRVNQTLAALFILLVSVLIAFISPVGIVYVIHAVQLQQAHKTVDSPSCKIAIGSDSV